MTGNILFFLFATIGLISGVGVIASRNPINSALWLIANFFCLALLYLTLHAQFIAVIQILVYTGAIMVLFLFVIMLLNLGDLPAVKDIDWKKSIAFVLAVVVLSQLVYGIAMAFDIVPASITPQEAAALGSARAIGIELFSRYMFLVQIIAVLLLAATIGAVLLAKKKFV